MNGVLESLRSLRHPDYRLYFLGQLVSMTGTWMQQTAQGWLVYRLTGSGAMLGVVVASGQLPSLFLGLIGGAAADRWDRRKVLLATQFVALIQAGLLAVLTSTGRVTVGQVLALTVLLGIVNAFDMPARQAFVTDLVPHEDQGNAIALSGILLNASRLVGPAIAGILIARWGEAACFWLNTASFVAVLGSLWAIRSRPRVAPEGGALRRIMEGLAYAFGDSERRSLLLLLAAVSLAGMPLFSLMPAFSEGVLRAGPKGLGWLTAGVGVGAMLASALLARRRNADGLPAEVGRAAVGFGFALAAFGHSPSVAFALHAAATAGFFMMTAFSGGNMRLQSRADDAHRGRLMSLFAMSFMATSPFGALGAGWASDRFGAPAALGAGGAACIFAGAAYLYRMRRAR